MTEDPVEAAEWLRTYRHPMTELISIGPWASYSAFNQGAGVDLPRLLLSDRVRSACAVEVAGLDYAAQQVKYLFAFEDAAEWIEANVETRVMSVVVPQPVGPTTHTSFIFSLLRSRALEHFFQLVLRELGFHGPSVRAELHLAALHLVDEHAQLA